MYNGNRVDCPYRKKKNYKSQHASKTGRHTLRFVILSVKRLLVCLDVSNSVTYSSNLFSLIIWNSDTEFLLKFHD